MLVFKSVFLELADAKLKNVLNFVRAFPKTPTIAFLLVLLLLLLACRFKACVEIYVLVFNRTIIFYFYAASYHNACL